MKRFFLISVIFAFFSSLSGFANGTLPPQAAALSFRYMTFDPGNDYDCKHVLQNADSHDWDVQCFDAQGKVAKRYTVHLWISLFNHPTAPQTSVEILYWLTDRLVPKVASSGGATTWLHFNPKMDFSAINGLQLSQSVDNDTAGLYLTIKN